MDLLQLEHFLAVVEERTFTRAAERVSRSQPAVSQSIKKLEEEVGASHGTGALRLNDQTGRPEWIGGVKYTIKDGIVYDAKKLLADVAAMVEKQKQAKRTTSSQ